MTNKECREKAEELLKELSIDEKMAQVAGILYMEDRYEKMLPYLDNGIGEISCLEVRNMKTLEEVLAWQRRVQDDIMERSPHHIPAIFHMEGLCGAFIQGATSLPSGVSRGASFDVELEEKMARMVAEQELSCGITHILAPVLDVAREPRMGRCGESYGEDPTVVAAMGTAYAKGIQGAEMEGKKADAVAKHFYGFHASTGGIHGAHCEISERTHLEVYGKPFQAAIREAQLRGVMPCYCSVNGEPFSASAYYLTDILRKEMGFDGLAFSDYSAINNIHYAQHVGESFAEAGRIALEAGMDQELPFPQCFNRDLAQMYKDKTADIRYLDEACLRVLTAKYRMGLFEHPYAMELKEVKALFENSKNYELTLQSARESLILLKNEGVLPLKPEIKKIALIGCHAANARSFFGGYTHLSMSEATLAAANSMAGVSTDGSTKAAYKTVPGTQIQDDETEEFDALLKLQKPECKNLFQELSGRLENVEVVYAYGYPKAGEDTSHFAEALEAARDADLILMTLGGKHGSGSVATMGEGVDGTKIGLAKCQEDFIEKAAELGRPMVGIHFGGRPISSDIADKYLDAIVEAWNPSEAGAQAIVDVLTGKVNPSGKLPVSVAYSEGQLPVFYAHPYGSSTHQGDSIGFKNYVDLTHEARYNFGFGLSYTSFAYDNLELSREEAEPEEEVVITFDVTNTGAVPGTEIVQLYLKDIYASMTRPVMELAGFARVELASGETKKVTFRIQPSQTAFLTSSRDIQWKIEKGEIEVLVGAASDDIRLKSSFRITKDAFIKGKERSFYALAEV